MRVSVVCQGSSQRLLLQSSDVSPLAERSCRPGSPQRAKGNLHFLEFLLEMKGFRPSILLQVQHLYRELKEFLVKIPEEESLSGPTASITSPWGWREAVSPLRMTSVEPQQLLRCGLAVTDPPTSPQLHPVSVTTFTFGKCPKLKKEKKKSNRTLYPEMFSRRLPS